MREVIIAMYLLGFKLLFGIFKLFPLKNKVTFVISFADNSLYIYKQLKQSNVNMQPVFLCQSQCYKIFKDTKEKTFLFETKNVWHTINAIYHLATSKKIIIDNYYGFLATIKFKEAVRCTQIWHAVGAIKQFGLKDPTNDTRHPRALDRFKKVYEKFDYIVVGSEFMASIYEEAFLAKKVSFLKTGVPRTDFFFQKEAIESARQSLYEINPALNDKKVILYAPTFRKAKKNVEEISLDLARIYEALKDEYVLILRLHPKVKSQINYNNLYPGFVFNYSGYPTINDLLVITDILISDYSSIPMEYAILGRKMIFYAYDLEQYMQYNGFWEDYEAVMPGPVVKTTDRLIDAILDGKTDVDKIACFAAKWNEYSTGNSSMLLVEKLFYDSKN